MDGRIPKGWVQTNQTVERMKYGHLFYFRADLTNSNVLLTKEENCEYSPEGNIFPLISSWSSSRCKRTKGNLGLDNQLIYEQCLIGELDNKLHVITTLLKNTLYFYNWKHSFSFCMAKFAFFWSRRLISRFCFSSSAFCWQHIFRFLAISPFLEDSNSEDLAMSTVTW